MIEVERGIPIPASRGGSARRMYPFDTMEVGDSFFVAGKSLRKFSGQVFSAARRYGRRYTCRAVDGGVRVWRVE